ncbi:MAG: hypothetical protein WBE48_11190, partial [Xanthobacteraceae bacterium]
MSRTMIGRCDPADIAAARRAARDQRADALLLEIFNAFGAKPCVQQKRGRLRQRVEHDAIEIEKGKKSRRHAQRVPREISLRIDL